MVEKYSWHLSECSVSVRLSGISIADIRTIGDFISIKMVSSTPKYPVFGGRDAFAYKGTLGGSIMGV